MLRLVEKHTSIIEFIGNKEIKKKQLVRKTKGDIHGSKRFRDRKNEVTEVRRQAWVNSNLESICLVWQVWAPAWIPVFWFFPTSTANELLDLQIKTENEYLGHNKYIQEPNTKNRKINFWIKGDRKNWPKTRNTGKILKERRKKKLL